VNVSGAKAKVRNPPEARAGSWDGRAAGWLRSLTPVSLGEHAILRRRSVLPRALNATWRPTMAVKLNSVGSMKRREKRHGTV